MLRYRSQKSNAYFISLSKYDGLSMDKVQKDCRWKLILCEPSKVWMNRVQQFQMGCSILNCSVPRGAVVLHPMNSMATAGVSSGKWTFIPFHQVRVQAPQWVLSVCAGYFADTDWKSSMPHTSSLGIMPCGSANLWTQVVQWWTWGKKSGVSSRSSVFT